MNKNVPALNKTNIKKRLSMTPPGSHYGVIDFKNVEVVPMRGEGDVGYVEVYIPFKLNTETRLEFNELASVVRQIEDVWGEVPFGDGKGMTMRKRRNCVYMCFKPQMY